MAIVEFTRYTRSIVSLRKNNSRFSYLLLQTKRLLTSMWLMVEDQSRSVSAADRPTECVRVCVCVYDHVSICGLTGELFTAAINANALVC